jgi:hypothetical protein
MERMIASMVNSYNGHLSEHLAGRLRGSGDLVDGNQEGTGTEIRVLLQQEMRDD